MLLPGCTAVLPPPRWPLPGHGCPRHSWAVPLTSSTARNGHHYRTRYRQTTYTLSLFISPRLCSCGCVYQESGWNQVLNIQTAAQTLTPPLPVTVVDGNSPPLYIIYATFYFMSHVIPSFIHFPLFSSCCRRVIHRQGQWPGARAFPRPGRQDWGWRGDPRQGRPSDSVLWRTKDHRRCRAGLCPEIGQGETDKWPSEPQHRCQAVCCAFQPSPRWWHPQAQGPGTWKVGAHYKTFKSQQGLKNLEIWCGRS